MTEQSLLERAARALCIADKKDPDADFRDCGNVFLAVACDNPQNWRTYIPKVRAVLMAVREPDKKWLDKAWENEKVVSWGDYEEFWQAMIDVALGE